MANRVELLLSGLLSLGSHPIYLPHDLDDFFSKSANQNFNFDLANRIASYKAIEGDRYLINKDNYKQRKELIDKEHRMRASYLMGNMNLGKLYILTTIPRNFLGVVKRAKPVSEDAKKGSTEKEISKQLEEIKAKLSTVKSGKKEFALVGKEFDKFKEITKGNVENYKRMNELGVLVLSINGNNKKRITGRRKLLSDKARLKTWSFGNIKINFLGTGNPYRDELRGYSIINALKEKDLLNSIFG